MSWESDAQAEIESAKNNLGGWISPALEQSIYDRHRADAEAESARDAGPAAAPVVSENDDDNEQSTSAAAPVSAPPAAASPPIVNVDVPASVHAGETFSASISASDPDGDLNSMGLRVQGMGLVGHWDLSGGNQSRSVSIIAPDSGPLLVRGEVWDNNNHGATGDWHPITIIPAPAAVVIQAPAYIPPVVISPTPSAVPPAEIAVPIPEISPVPPPAQIPVSVDTNSPPAQTTGMPAAATDALNSWVRVIQVPTSTPGVHDDVLEFLPGAPEIVRLAVDDANAAARDLGGIGGLSPAQEYGLIQRAYNQRVAEGEAAHFATPPLTNSGESGDVTSTIVAYEGTNPVIQTVTPTGTVVQHTETPGGQTNVTTVSDFGSYEPTSAAVAAVSTPVVATPISIFPGQFSGSPPTLSLLLPQSVLPGEKFTAAITANDPNGDLLRMSLRWQGQGLVGTWDLTGGAQTRTVQMTAPAEVGAMMIRGEVIDAAGNGTTGDWISVPVQTDTDFDPTHRLAGYDAQGRSVYRLTDEAGNVVEWSVMPGHDSADVVPGSLHYLSGPNAVASAVVTTTAPAASPTTTAKNSSGSVGGFVLIGAAIGAGVWFARRRRNKG